MRSGKKDSRTPNTVMPHGTTREAEEQQLAEVIRIAENNLKRMRDRVTSLTGELHEMLETYGAKDKETLALWHNTQSQLDESRRDLIRCEKARKKPYFGRIDFQDPQMQAEESYYIGRVGIAKTSSEPVVIDWRAPVASVYYENSIGHCRYEVKGEGAYEIDLKRKRTYEIADDRLIDFFDSDVVANDDLLTKYLGKNKKAVLGEIIATIQKEQNAIIRQSPKTNIIVQGVAGSGKTTVAMHRISYILYNYEQFRPEDFYIIGSNRILLDYITSVLPDLDVYGIRQMTMEELFVRLLYEDWNPLVHKIKALDRKDARACIKGSYAWFHELEDFCMRYENDTIPRHDIRIEKTGALLMEAERIATYLRNNPMLSMQGKINLLNEFLLSRLENELSGRQVTYTKAEQKSLQREYKTYFGKEEWKGSIFTLYEEFLQMQRENGKIVPYTPDTFDVYDLAALAYLYKRIKEIDGIREASHVIIDEAQDFGMMAYGALKFCLRECTYTIMGDVSQNIYFNYGLNDWEDLKKLILTGSFDGFGILKKSYRNTVEISNFATEILRHGNFRVYPVEPIIRHGKEVCVTACADDTELLDQTAEQIRSWQQAGYDTIAVICRDEAEASRVSSQLAAQIVLADSNPTTAEFGSGVMVLPVEYTKGLEFDAVLLYNPSEEKYPATDAFVKLLYVAATRALHELAVLHTGDLTKLIADPVAEGKQMQAFSQQGFSRTKRVETKQPRKQTEEEVSRRIKQQEYIGPKRIIVSKPVQTENAVVIRKTQQLDTGKQPHTADQGRQNVQKTMAADLYRKPYAQAEKVPGKVTAASDKPVNPSPYAFAAVPDMAVLRPVKHSQIDSTVKSIKKTKKYLELTSGYGTLRITPVTDGILRIQFKTGQTDRFASGYWDCTPDVGMVFQARESRSMVQMDAGEVQIRVEKKTGALQFYNRKGSLLLEENPALPRQLEPECNTMRVWNYFCWKKEDRLAAKGILDDSFERMNQKARYISFGKKPLRMPLLVSDAGYGIGVAAENTVLCCNIPVYGQYYYTEGMKQSDYYFIYGGSREQVIKLYKKLTYKP